MASDHADFNALNERLGATLHPYDGRLVTLRFDGVFAHRQLWALYGRLLGMNLDLAPISNVTSGDGSYVAYDLEGWPYRYLYAIRFGDCPAG